MPLPPLIGSAAASAAIALGAALPVGAAAQDDPSAFVEVVGAQQARAAIQTLNGYLRPLSRSVTITRCDMLVTSHPGKVEIIYAGICQLRSGARAMMCGDTGVGEFGLTPWRSRGAPADAPVLRRFTRANCPGG